MKLIVIALILGSIVGVPVAAGGIGYYLHDDARQQAWHKRDTVWEITSDGKLTDRGLEIPVKEILNRAKHRIEIEIKDTFVISLDHPDFNRFFDQDKNELKNVEKGRQIRVTYEASKPYRSIWAFTMEDYANFQPATPARVVY